ncbi:MAG: glycoside hydrolase family 31 protein [Clostridiaceae bacterium]|nr:glycoside hydrolase family 31 protein [Clostridiaceae bacterium]
MKEEQLYIQAVNDQILRIFSKDALQKQSFAVGDIQALSEAIPLSEVGAAKEKILETRKLSVKVAGGRFLSVFDREGTLLCEDWDGERQETQALSETELEQLRAEGHAVDEMAAQAFSVVKRFVGDEVVYGLGDKTGFLNKRGYQYMMWNSDNPDPHVENGTFKAMYKSIPFFIVLREDAVYGIFLDNTYRSYFDMGYEDTRYYSFGAAGGVPDYYFIGGDTIAEVIYGYTELTGRAPLPQLWTLGYHQSRWSYGSSEEVRSLAEKLRKYEIPCDAIHLDIDYMDHFKVFTVSGEAFPDLTGLGSELAKQGIRLVSIIDPGTKAEAGYSLYDTGIEKEYFAKTKEGEVYHNAVWPGDSVYPDYTSAAVRQWWGDQAELLTSQGIQGIWNDMNEPASFQGPLPDDVLFYGDGTVRRHEEVHNVYGHLMAQATYEGLKRATGKRPFVITRACYSGSQKYTTAWTGDNQSLWTHLQMSIPQLLNLGMSGMPLVGTDIGGFGANATPELLCRWVEASCFAPLFRNHSAKFTRRQEPWQFDQRTLYINRKYIALHYHFLPYLYDLCYEESLTGMPVLRPLAMHYQNDKNTWECNDEYLVGSQILAAPVTSQGAKARMVYLPEGTWVDYWSGERIPGSRYILREAPLEVCPIYVRAGSILPAMEPVLSIQPENMKKLILEFYPADRQMGKENELAGKKGQEVRYIHYQDNGTDFAYQDGEYNLYEFRFSGERSSGLSVSMIHEGYEGKYQTIEAVIR